MSWEESFERYVFEYRKVAKKPEAPEEIKLTVGRRQ